MTQKQPTNLLVVALVALLIMVQACSPTRNMSKENPSQRSTKIDTLDATETDYRIRPGDELEILVWEQPSFNTVTTVSKRGSIAIPLIGELVVSGLTREELKRDIKRELSEYIKGEMNLTVSIRNTDDSVVSVFGMVVHPDNYPVVDQTTIFRILSSAGGPTEFANMKEVKLYKQSGPENYVTLNLMDFLESGQMHSPALMVQSGDIIYVPKKENAVREMSEFLRDVIILFGIFRVFR